MKVKKNILASFLIKAADTLVYFLLVPLTLGYLNAYEYGIWLTLSSLLSWINSFDIGLGNGLRNKLAIALAEGNYEKGRIYVSTTLYMLVILATIISLFFSVIICNIDWYTLLNVKEEVVGNLEEIVLVSFLFFCFNFVLKFIGNVYQALQLAAFNNLIILGGHVVSFILILILKYSVPGSLFWVALSYSSATPIIYLLCYPITFYKLYPYLSPSIHFFRKEYIKDLLSLGVLFFIIQIMAVVLFSMSNLMISNLFGPDQVTPYNISFRYFSIVPIFFNLLLAPMWSAATDAYAKKDLDWINSVLKKLQKVLVIIALCILLMILCSDFIYHLWVGDSVNIPFIMSVLMGIYQFIYVYSLCYSYMLNGMGKLRLQTINIVIVGISFCPLCYFFSIPYGVIGIIITMCVVNLSGAILNTIQLHYILNGKASGILLK